MTQERMNIGELKKAKKKNLEKDVQRQIYKYIEAKGHWITRWNNAGIFDLRRGSFRSHPWVKKGMPDLLVFWEDTAIAIECKSEIGKWAPEQRDFARRWELSGNLYILARSLDDVINAGL